MPKTSAPTTEAAPERLPVESWAEQKATPAWLLAAMRAGYRWGIGRELTEAEFDSAVHLTANAPVGYGQEK